MAIYVCQENDLEDLRFPSKQADLYFMRTLCLEHILLFFKFHVKKFIVEVIALKDFYGNIPTLIFSNASLQMASLVYCFHHRKTTNMKQTFVVNHNTNTQRHF